MRVYKNHSLHVFFKVFQRIVEAWLYGEQTFGTSEFWSFFRVCSRGCGYLFNISDHLFFLFNRKSFVELEKLLIRCLCLFHITKIVKYPLKLEIGWGNCYCLRDRSGGLNCLNHRLIELLRWHGMKCKGF